MILKILAFALVFAVVVCFVPDVWPGTLLILAFFTLIQIARRHQSDDRATAGIRWQAQFAAALGLLIWLPALLLTVAEQATGVESPALCQAVGSLSCIVGTPIMILYAINALLANGDADKMEPDPRDRTAGQSGSVVKAVVVFFCAMGALYGVFMVVYQALK